MIWTLRIWAERKRMHAYLRTSSLSPSSIHFASTSYTRFVAVMTGWSEIDRMWLGLIKYPNEMTDEAGFIGFEFLR